MKFKHKKLSFPQTTPIDEPLEINRLKISSVDDLRAGSLKNRYRIKGDWWRPAKGPPMVKSMDVKTLSKKKILFSLENH